MVVWTVANVVADPDRFVGSLLVGLQNGLLYALVALGYTMVYGIIELINFAHGDLFMLATIVAAALMVSVMGVGDLTAASILPLLVAMVVCMAFGAGVNMASERLAYRRLRSAPKLAPLMTAVGLSFIFRGIAQQDYINGSAQKNWPVIWGGPQVEGVFIYKLLMVFAISVPLLLVMTWIVTKTQDGQGDAGRRPGPGRCAADGDQRQRHHLVHVRPRRRAGRRGRACCTSCARPRPTTTPAPSSA